MMHGQQKIKWNFLPPEFLGLCVCKYKINKKFNLHKSINNFWGCGNGGTISNSPHQTEGKNEKNETQIGLPVTNKLHRRYRYIYPFERCVTATLTSSSVASPLDVSVLVASQLLLHSLVSLWSNQQMRRSSSIIYWHIPNFNPTRFTNSLPSSGGRITFTFEMYQ
jgi:hypothetical protein